MHVLKTVLKMFLGLLAGTIAGILLLMLAFRIPGEPIYTHVRDSAYVFEIEGLYPAMDNKVTKILDNWTDALMLMQAFYEEEGAGTLDRSLNVYHPEYKNSDPVNTLLTYMSGRPAEYAASYPRYWHGYLIWLKPLLAFTDYLGFRSINRVVQAAVLLAAAAALVMRGQKRIILPFLAAVCYLRPTVVAFSLQNSTVFYITWIALIAAVLWNRKLRQGIRYLYYFMAVGMAVNYFDLLTYPIITLGIPMAMWLVMQSDVPFMGKIKAIVLYSASWAFGYFGMWIMKWTAASLLLRKNVFKDALMQAGTRLSGLAQGESFTRWDVIRKNVLAGFSGIWLLAIVLIATVFLACIWKYRRGLRRLAAHIVPYLLVCLMPLAWYAVLGNHSFIHVQFTYRALAVVVFAGLCMGVEAVGNVKLTKYRGLEWKKS